MRDLSKWIIKWGLGTWAVILSIATLANYASSIFANLQKFYPSTTDPKAIIVSFKFDDFFLNKTEAKDDKPANLEYSIRYVVQVYSRNGNFVLEKVDPLYGTKVLDMDNNDLGADTSAALKENYNVTFKAASSRAYPVFFLKSLEGKDVKEYFKQFDDGGLDYYGDRSSNVDGVIHCWTKNYIEESPIYKMFGYRSVAFKLTFDKSEFDRYCYILSVPFPSDVLTDRPPSPLQ